MTKSYNKIKDDFFEAFDCKKDTIISTWKYIIVSLLFISFLRILTSVLIQDCQQLYTFDGDILYSLLSKCFNLLRITLVYYFCYKYLLKSKSFINYKLYLIIFGITMIADYPSVINAFKAISTENRNIRKSICQKSTDDGRIYKVENLTLNEYNFYSNKTSWFPKIPIYGDSISIEYYRDDFLGDYFLQIKMKTTEQLDSMDSKKWKEYNMYISKPPWNKKMKNWYIYESGQQ